MLNKIETKNELQEALKSARCCIIFTKDECLHCAIVKNVIDDIKKEYPLINFCVTESREITEAYHINAYPTLHFYDNGSLQGTLIGSNNITKIKDILNLWFLKN